MATRGVLALLAAVLMLTGCGEAHYTPPATQITAPAGNTMTLDIPYEKVWSKAVAGLGKDFFVINNLDKESGFVNVSYSGDPEQYVDCGRYYSKVNTIVGPKVYDFPMASEHVTFFEQSSEKHIQAYNAMVDNQLDGRINIVFERSEPNKTKVTVNVRYLLNRTITLQGAYGDTSVQHKRFAFNTGGATSPTAQDRSECRPTGRLEAEVLQALGS